MKAHPAERSAAGAVRAPLPGGRWHFQHGPIDLVLQAWGDAGECARAYEQAWTRFATVLPELVAELPLLRSPLSLGERGLGVRGSKNGSAPRAQRHAASITQHEGPVDTGPGRIRHVLTSNTVFAAPHPLPPLPQGEGASQERQLSYQLGQHRLKSLPRPLVRVRALFDIAPSLQHQVDRPVLEMPAPARKRRADGAGGAAFDRCCARAHATLFGKGAPGQGPCACHC